MTNKVVDSSSLSKPLFVEDHHDAKDIGHDIWYFPCNTVYPIKITTNYTSITESNSIFSLIIKVDLFDYDKWFYPQKYTNKEVTKITTFFLHGT